MTKLTTLLACSALLVVAPAGCGDDGPPPAKTALDQGETAKAEFRDEIGGRLAEIETKIAKLERDGVDDAILDPLRAKQEEARRIYEDAEAAVGDAWEDARDEAERAVLRLEREYEAAVDAVASVP